MPNKVRVYTDIESLLDVRQGYLISKGLVGQELHDFMKSPEYLFRDTNNFKDYPEGDYEAAFYSGDRNILMGSGLSYMFSVIRNDILNVSEANGHERSKKSPCLVVNIYPYTLSAEEEDLWKDGLYYKLNLPCYIEMVSIPPAELTPIFIREVGYKSCYIYDFSNWLNHHTTSLMTGLLNEVDMHFPVVNKTTLNAEDKEKLDELLKMYGASDYFEITKASLISLMRVQFKPITYYTNFIIAYDTITEHEKIALAKIEEKYKLSDIDKERLDEYLS